MISVKVFSSLLYVRFFFFFFFFSCRTDQRLHQAQRQRLRLGAAASSGPAQRNVRARLCCRQVEKSSLCTPTTTPCCDVIRSQKLTAQTKPRETSSFQSPPTGDCQRRLGLHRYRPPCSLSRSVRTALGIENVFKIEVPHAKCLFSCSPPRHREPDGRRRAGAPGAGVGQVSRLPLLPCPGTPPSSVPPLSVLIHSIDCQ